MTNDAMTNELPMPKPKEEFQPRNVIGPSVIGHFTPVRPGRIT